MHDIQHICFLLSGGVRELAGELEHLQSRTLELERLRAVCVGDYAHVHPQLPSRDLEFQTGRQDPLASDVLSEVISSHGRGRGSAHTPK